MLENSEEIDKRYTVTDDETLYRLISYPGCIDENNKPSPEIFSLYHKDEDYVSVDRAYYSSLEESMNLGSKIKRWPIKKDKFWGIIVLNAGKVRSVSERILVASHYAKERKAHAGISYLQDDGTKLKHTGQEVIPSWLLLLQLQLCDIVDEVIKA